MRIFIFFAVILRVASAQEFQTECPGNVYKVTQQCIDELGLGKKVERYKLEIDGAIGFFKASYQISLRVVNNDTLEGALNPDVVIEPILDAYDRPEAFVVSVHWRFLLEQTDILFEHSARHEVGHIIIDDMNGYLKNGLDVEFAVENTIYTRVGEERYREYMTAYLEYRGFGLQGLDAHVEKVKRAVPHTSPLSIGRVDKLADEFFKENSVGKEYLLLFNGELHDITKSSTSVGVTTNISKLVALVRVNRSIVILHNHLAKYGRNAMYPSYVDYGGAVRLLFEIFKVAPHRTVTFRVLVSGDETTSVLYGLKKPVVDMIRKNAVLYTEALTRLEQIEPDTSESADDRKLLLDITKRMAELRRSITARSFNEYLVHGCQVDLGRPYADDCEIHPERFIRPSDIVFLRYLGTF